MKRSPFSFSKKEALVLILSVLSVGATAYGTLFYSRTHQEAGASLLPPTPAVSMCTDSPARSQVITGNSCEDTVQTVITYDGTWDGQDGRGTDREERFVTDRVHYKWDCETKQYEYTDLPDEGTPPDASGSAPMCYDSYQEERTVMPSLPLCQCPS